MTPSVGAVRLFPQISPKAYEHPADRAATSALQAIPLMDKLLKRLSELGLEKRHRSVLLGNAVRLGESQLGDVWRLHAQVALTLDVDVPPLYVTQTPVVNGMTVGSNAPLVIITSSLATDYHSDDLRTVLAHEMGHVLSEHFYYTSVLNLLAQILTGTFALGGFGLLAGLPVRALYVALLEWSRAAELSCDRAAAIVTGDPRLTCGTLMRMAGGPLPNLDLDAFLLQASEYAAEDDLFARRARFGIELSQRHPFAVRRVKELMDWVSTGDFNRITSGSYVRRGQEPPVSAQFDAAVQHYRRRFVAMMDRTVGGVNKLAGQIQSWLRRDQAERGADDDGGLDPDPY